MFKQLKSYKPSPAAALVIALLALVAALSTPAQAAMERLAKGSVGTAQLKNGAVTTPKIRNGAVTSPKVRNGAVTSSKIAGNAVSSGKIANGSVGLADLSSSARPKHPRSVSTRVTEWIHLSWDGVEMARLDLAAGHWLVLAKGIASVSGGASVQCYLGRGLFTFDSSYTYGESQLYDNLALISPVPVVRTSAVTVTCYGPPESQVGQVALSAVEVRS